MDVDDDIIRRTLELLMDDDGDSITRCNMFFLILLKNFAFRLHWSLHLGNVN